VHRSARRKQDDDKRARLAADWAQIMLAASADPGAEQRDADELRGDQINAPISPPVSAATIIQTVCLSPSRRWRTAPPDEPDPEDDAEDTAAGETGGANEQDDGG
jgi:hypothetical protein